MAASPARLKVRAEFLRAAQRGRKAALPSLVVQAFARGDDAPVRLGFTVTKKVGNSVVRNRTRRRMREAARLLLRESAPAGVDLVLIGRDSTRKRPFLQLIEDLQRAMVKLGVPVP
jgi:ribonuclease P protein component